MTGFGKSTSQSNDFFLDVTIKAVNGRFLEVKFHGPKLYHSLETEVRKRLSQSMKRGTFDIYINRKAFNGTEKVNFNKKLAKKWLQGFGSLARELNLDRPQSAEILLSVPELIKVEDDSLVTPQEKKKLFKVLDEALAACDRVRKTEGLTLKKDLKNHLKKLSQQVQKIKKLRDQTVKDLKKKYEKKLLGYNLSEGIDEQRLAQEIVILVDKSDINEEIQRLEAHLKAISQLLNQTGSIGKKLDFYAQELLREVNTIGSKSSSSRLTQEVVEAKSWIEKYREQVQNVE
jgi:uncharacterized protein (TIGR00255 family)